MYYLIGVSEYPITASTIFQIVDSKSFSVWSKSWQEIYTAMVNNPKFLANAELAYERVNGQLSVDIVLKSGSMENLPIVQNGVCVKNKNFFVLCRYVVNQKTLGYLILNYLGQPKKVSIKDLCRLTKVKFVNAKLSSSSEGYFLSAIRGNLPAVQLKLDGKLVERHSQKVTPKPVDVVQNGGVKRKKIRGIEYVCQPNDYTIENGLLLKYNGEDKDILIPDSVTKIGTKAFYDCKSLKSVIIPDGVTEIGCDAFNFCAELTSVEIPDGVVSIGVRAFCNCKTLEKIVIPNGVKVIDSTVFWWCSSLRSVVLSENVTVIGDYAFNGCSLLGSIELSDNVVSIGKSAFEYCDSLVVKCHRGSYAEQYCKDNNIKYKIV